MDETNGIGCTVLAPDGVTEQPAVMPPPEPTDNVERMEARLRVLEDEARAAQARVYRMKAAIDSANGDCFLARWHSALADDDNATAHACYVDSQARHYLRTGEFFGDISEKVKAELMAEVERLKAAKV